MYLIGAPLLAAVVADLQTRVPTGLIAGRFHAAVADLIVALALRLRGSHHLNTVALSGGVFQNVMLLEMALRRLQRSGFDVLTHRLVPPNDGGLALGQAMIGSHVSG